MEITICAINPFATALFTPSVAIYRYVTQLIVMYFSPRDLLCYHNLTLRQKSDPKILVASGYKQLWQSLALNMGPLCSIEFCGSWPQ